MLFLLRAKEKKEPGTLTKWCMHIQLLAVALFYLLQTGEWMTCPGSWWPLSRSASPVKVIRNRRVQSGWEFMTWPSLRVENEHFKINSVQETITLIWRSIWIVQVIDGVFLFFTVGRGLWSLWDYSGVSQAVSWESQKFRVRVSATMRVICNWKVARALINLGHLSDFPSAGVLYFTKAETYGDSSL